jgi:glycosyltransferase involved in cell wall biosynthesis
MKPRLLAYLGGLDANSTRFRFLNYLPILEKHFDVAYGSGRPDGEAFKLGRSDILFIQKNLPRLGWTVWTSRSVKSRIVYEFDDAVWTNASGSWSLPTRARRRARLRALLKRSDLVIAANQFLGDYARKVTDRVSVIPIGVTIAPMTPSSLNPTQPTKVGWAGHPYGHYLLKTIESELREFIRRHPDIRFIVLSGRRPEIEAPFEWWPHSLEAEERFFREVDVGLVPSTNSTFDLGKSPLKAIQHFCNARPVVTNGLGATRDLVDESTGYLVDTPDQWQIALDRAVNDPRERAAKGTCAYARVRDRHALEVVGNQLASQLLNLSASRVPGDGA